MSRGVRLFLSAVCVAGAMTFGVTAWRLLDSPLRFDETDFIGQALGITRHGVPKILYAESRQIPTARERERNGGVAQLGMWHPPLYQYTLAASFESLGFSNWSARGVGLLWFVLTALVVWQVAGRYAPGDPMLRALPISIALLSPIVAQGIFFIDIDNTALAFASILFGALFTTDPHDHSVRKTILLAAVLLLALWSKLTTPVIVMMAVFVFYVFDRDWRGVGQAVAIGVIAAGAFAATYLLYCRLTGYPADFMFRFSYVGKSDAYTSVGTLISKLHAIWWTVIWFSPALSLLLIVTTIERAWQYVRRRRVEPLDYWVVFSWGCFGAYAVWGGVMGKYTFPAAVAAAVACGLWLPAQLRDVRVMKPMMFAASATAVLVFQLVAIPPLEVKAPAAHVAASTARDAIADPRNVALMMTLVGFAVFAGVARLSLTGGTVAGRLAMLLLACAATANTIDAFKLMVSPDDRSPYRPFRERGFGDTIATLNERLSETDTLIAGKDIGFYFHGRSYALEGILEREGAAAIAPLMRDQGIAYAVDSIMNPILPDSDRVFRSAGLAPVDRAGDYVIYGPAK